ncbi:MAG: RagB/SusD family nutrient uptake outer membrane protein [Longimicrobiales bacterium]
MTPNKRGRVASAASLVAVAGMSLLALACTTDDILQVEDPDIINPSNVTSAAGANAVRLGALSRFVGLTTGEESLFFLGGLFTDEWLNGDSYIYKQEVDQRITPKENSGIEGAMRTLHRVRLSAQQAVELLDEWNPSAPGWHTGEMFMLQAYALNIMAEHYCDGMIISNVVEGREEYGEQMTAAQVYEIALARANDGLARVTTGSTADDVRVRNALALTKGRILVNLNRHAEAATAVSGVATNAEYVVHHSQTTWTNQFWNLNLNSGRYSVSDKEGVNGLDFASAKDPRVPVCETREAACRALGAGRNNRDDLNTPLLIFMRWAGREQAVPVMQGVDARMIEAEAALKAGNAAGALTILNTARATMGLTPLADAGSASARVDQLFRERAFWQYGRGFRTGDMRRLIRQYGRNQSQVFPIGEWHKGGSYGTDVDFPLPFDEENNPNLGIGGGCLSRGA